MSVDLLPFTVTICGIPEIDKHHGTDVSHVLSIIDPDEPVPPILKRMDLRGHRVFRFDDIVADYPGFDSPQRGHVAELLEFGRSLDAGTRHLLIHCHAGVSRSTAAAAILMAQPNPGREDEAFLALLDMRPHAWPNTRMVQFADALLERDGALVAGLEVYRRTLLQRKPHLAKIVRDIGRGHELPA